VVFAEDPSTFVSTWRAETPSGFWQQRRRWASNAFTQLRLNPAFFGYTVIVFLVNLVLPAALAVGIMSGAYGLPLACLSLKIAGDMLVTLKGAKKFDRLDLIGVFPIWELLQAPYIVLVAMASLFTGYTWKGIKHK
jgi:cellulose synthase/poly-beta-1,6-N-acetylglucosamine synthase-like glycosyltransferase